MKTTIEHIDEFIDLFFCGDIESRLVDSVEKFDGDDQTAISERIGELTDNITKYRKETNPKKKKVLAEEIFDLVIIFRLSGIFRNHPYPRLYLQEKINVLENQLHQVTSERDQAIERLAQKQLPPEKKGFTAIS